MATPPAPAPAPSVMDEGAQTPAPAPAPAGGGDQAQTVEVPLSAVPDAQEGATVSFKVVSVDQQNGVVNLAPASGEPEGDESGGTEGMAGEFDREKMSKEGA